MPKAAYDAVVARLGSSWTSQDSSILPVLGLNSADQKPSDGSAFIDVEMPVVNEKQFDLGDPGNNLWRDEGVFRLIVNEARTAGYDRALGWCDELAALFRGKTFSNVQCFEVSGPVIDDRSFLGAYFQISIAVRFWFYVTG